jgi:hypothetical protein
MTRMPVYILAALLAAAPLSAVAQDRDLPNDRPRERPRDRTPREQSDLQPHISVGAAVQRASAGRPGRFLGASSRGDMIVVRWEYPGGRVADIVVDGRTGRVIGER